MSKMKRELFFKYSMPIIASSAFLILAFILFRDYKLGDDTYIYLQYAKHIIHNGEISFNLGERSYGFTSPLWLGLITFLSFVINSPLVAPELLSMFFSILTVIVWCFIFINLQLDLKKVIVGLVVIILDPNLLKHSFLGMEASISYFLSSFQIVLLLKYTKGSKQIFLFSVVSSIYFLIRPESALPSIILFLFLLKEKKVVLSDLFYVLIIGSIIVLPWHIFAYNYFGSLFPSTFVAKGGSYFWGEKFLENSSDSVIIILGNYFIYLFVALLFLINKRKGIKIDLTKNLYKVFIGIVILLVIFYSFSLNREIVYARYYCMVFPFINFIFLSFLLKTERKSYYIITIITLLAISTAQSIISQRTFVENENSEFIPINWINKNANPDDVIVRGRIGKIGYLTDRKILDPVGLINPEIIAYYRNNNISQFYLKYKPKYFIGDSKQLKTVISKNAKSKIVASIEHKFPFLIRDFILTNGSHYESIYELDWNTDK